MGFELQIEPQRREGRKEGICKWFREVEPLRREGREGKTLIEIEPLRRKGGDVVN